MDLRPRLARAFVDAIADDLTEMGVPFEESDVDRWVGLVLDRFVSRSVPHIYCSETEEGGIALFRAKYPELEPVIGAVQEAARFLWPEAGFTFELHSDPEGCHICHEGQHLTMLVHTGEADPDDPDAWATMACDSMGLLDDLILEDDFPRHELLLVECRPGSLDQYVEGLRRHWEERKAHAEEMKAAARARKAAREAGE